jgi:dienelactone hydrolase
MRNLSMFVLLISSCLLHAAAQATRIVKLRYEIVPGFSSTALLYEPEHMTGKMPAILNVNGHGAGGKAVEHKQKRCINQARRGILALSLEWIGMGELSSPDNEHNQIGLLDLAGANGVGLFYLAMRRGPDYLYDDPRVDRTRIGVTGLSGGGWQTMLLSTLDTRVGPAVPVAGFSSLTTSIEHPDYAGDAEQNGSDMRSVADYAQLMALRAPWPTLLIYNAMDDCCFRASVVKQGVYTDIKPFFALMGSPQNLQWYENGTPGTHNYQIDSREQSYRFFDRAFQLQASDKEDADTDTEVQSAADLAVGIPANNLTIVSLARQLGQAIHHEPPAHADELYSSIEARHAVASLGDLFSTPLITMKRKR